MFTSLEVPSFRLRILIDDISVDIKQTVYQVLHYWTPKNKFNQNTEKYAEYPI